MDTILPALWVGVGTPQPDRLTLAIPDDDRTSEEFVRDALARMDWHLSAPPIGRGMWEEIKPCPACGEHTCTATQVRMGMVCSRCYEERILRRENEDAGDD